MKGNQPGEVRFHSESKRRSRRGVQLRSSDPCPRSRAPQPLLADPAWGPGDVTRSPSKVIVLQWTHAEPDTGAAPPNLTRAPPMLRCHLKHASLPHHPMPGWQDRRDQGEGRGGDTNTACHLLTLLLSKKCHISTEWGDVDTVPGLSHTRSPCRPQPRGEMRKHGHFTRGRRGDSRGRTERVQWGKREEETKTWAPASPCPGAWP